MVFRGEKGKDLKPAVFYIDPKGLIFPTATALTLEYLVGGAC